MIPYDARASDTVRSVHTVLVRKSGKDVGRPQEQMSMQPEVTITSNEYERVLYGDMTPAMAVAYLSGNQLPVRTFGGILRQMYPYCDLKDRLVAFFTAQTPSANPQSIVRKITNWLTDRNVPMNRCDLFRIAFALDFQEAQLDYLLSMCTDYGIQYRDGYEAVLAWFLRKGYCYAAANEFYAQLPKPPGMDRAEGVHHSNLTREVQKQFLLAQTTEELRQCYLRNLNSMGRLHLRAYYYFDKFLSTLIHPTPSWIDVPEPYYSIETVMSTYLSMQMPRRRSRDGYSLVQRLLSQNWPNATALKNIRNHKEDVPRKLLILLYIITEESATVQREIPPPSDLTMEDRIEEHWWSLNAMLTDCGMALMDPRNVSDWLFLYAIGADNNDQSMSERLEQVIALMYADI